MASATSLDRALPWLFALLALPLSLFLALSVPTGEVPDEPAHVVRADSLWHGEVFGHRVTLPDGLGGVRVDSGVTANRALLAASVTMAAAAAGGPQITREGMHALAQVAWDEQPGFVSVPNTAVYLPAFYVPAAIGLRVARAVGLGPFEAFLVARAANAVAFVVVGGLALSLARAGRAVMFVTLSLPMTLWLAGSVNPDGLLIATAALGAACLSRRTPGPRWPVALAGLCLALLGAAKPCYLPMALAILARPDSFARGPGPRRSASLVAIVALPGLLWALSAAAFVAAPFVRPAYLPGPLWPGDPGRVFRSTDVAAQLLVLAHRPWRIVVLPVRSIWLQARQQAITAIGVLGLLDVVLPRPLYLAWGMAGAAGIVADLLGRSTPRQTGDLPRLTWSGALTIVGAALASIVAVYLLQYLSWTSVGATSVDGVQGRYFLPLLPFLGLAPSAARFGAWPRLRALATAVPIAVAAAQGAVIARLVLTTYYLR